MKSCHTAIINESFAVEEGLNDPVRRCRADRFAGDSTLSFFLVDQRAMRAVISRSVGPIHSVDCGTTKSCELSAFPDSKCPWEKWQKSFSPDVKRSQVDQAPACSSQEWGRRVFQPSVQRGEARRSSLQSLRACRASRSRHMGDDKHRNEETVNRLTKPPIGEGLPIDDFHLTPTQSSPAAWKTRHTPRG